jgi:hypothetical protein
VHDETQKSVLQYRNKIPTEADSEIESSEVETVCAFVLDDTGRSKLPEFMIEMESFQSKALKFCNEVPYTSLDLAYDEVKGDLWMDGDPVDSKFKELIQDMSTITAIAAYLDWCKKYKDVRLSKSASDDWEKMTNVLNRKGWTAPPSILKLAQG